MQIAEDEFDITAYGEIRETVRKFPKVQIITGFDISLISGLYGQKITIIGGKQTEPHAKAIYGDVLGKHIADADYTERQELVIEDFVEQIKGIIKAFSRVYRIVIGKYVDRYIFVSQ